MKWAVKTHIGKIRENNEDSYFVDEENNSIFIVADGMGGHNAGEVASKIAIETVSSYLKSQWENILSSEKTDFNFIIKSAIDKANKKIFKESHLHKECDGMGTTLTVALILDNKAIIGHIGDSRAYILKNNELIQLTQDHTLVNELLRNGSITEVEAKTHPKRNIITKALGTEISIKPDIFNIDINSKDILILCTDGLTNIIDNEEIRDIFIKSGDLQIACDSLVDLANLRGGYDNITIIAIKI